MNQRVVVASHVVLKSSTGSMVGLTDLNRELKGSVYPGEKIVNTKVDVKRLSNYEFLYTFTAVLDKL